MFPGRRTAAVLLVVAFIALACSNGEPVSDQTSTDDHTHSHDVGEATDNFTFTLGMPGDVAAANRSISVVARRGFRFTPARVKVRVGDTVTFSVKNADEIDHEFVLGNRQYQELHEDEVEAGGVYHDYSAYSVHVPPGDSATVTWMFDRSGRIFYACHIPGHYDKGMIGTIDIS